MSENLIAELRHLSGDYSDGKRVRGALETAADHLAEAEATVERLRALVDAMSHWRDCPLAGDLAEATARMVWAHDEAMAALTDTASAGDVRLSSLEHEALSRYGELPDVIYAWRDQSGGAVARDVDEGEWSEKEPNGSTRYIRDAGDVRRRDTCRDTAVPGTRLPRASGTCGTTGDRCE